MLEARRKAWNEVRKGLPMDYGWMDRQSCRFIIMAYERGRHRAVSLVAQGKALPLWRGLAIPRVIEAACNSDAKRERALWKAARVPPACLPTENHRAVGLWPGHYPDRSESDV
jgi:hypothetical protein